MNKVNLLNNQIYNQPYDTSGSSRFPKENYSEKLRETCLISSGNEENPFYPKNTLTQERKSITPCYWPFLKKNSKYFIRWLFGIPTKQWKLALPLACIFVFSSVFPAFSQQELYPASRNNNKNKGQSPFLQVNSVGDVLWSLSPNPGPFHVDGALALWTADYFRARYGGVPARLEYLSYRLYLSGTVELIKKEKNEQKFLQALSLSLGNLNYLTKSPKPDEDSWYTSDSYVGIGAALDSTFRTGLVYVAYKNPYSPPGVSQDLAFQLIYEGNNTLGSLQPQIKAVKAVGQGTGYLFQLQVTPVFKPFKNLPLTLAVPYNIGAGFNGYHGKDVEEGYYTELALLMTYPLNLKIPGRWLLSAGTYMILRDEDIVNATEKYDDAEYFVPSGFITLSFTY